MDERVDCSSFSIIGQHLMSRDFDSVSVSGYIYSAITSPVTRWIFLSDGFLTGIVRGCSCFQAGDRNMALSPFQFTLRPLSLSRRCQISTVADKRRSFVENYKIFARCSIRREMSKL